MSSNLITIQASEYTIKSVSVSKSARAEVVRTFPIDLKQGHNKLEIKGLPSNIYAVRTSGLGSTARLDDFLCTVGRDKSATYVEDSSSEIVRALSVKKAALESEKTIRGQELHVLSKYAETLTGEHISPKQLSEFLQSYVEQSRKIVQANTELDEKIVQIVRQIDEQKMTSRQGQAMTRIDAVISSDTNAAVTLNLTYIVYNCSWDATYELRTTNENGKPSPSVSLHYLATVKQSTGEDWTDAVLTLSTNQTNILPKSLPRLGRLEIHQPGAKPFNQNRNQAANPFKTFVPQSTSMFPPPNRSLFGPSPAFNTNSTGLFGGQAQTIGTSGGLFGASTQATGSGLFGAPAQNNPPLFTAQGREGHPPSSGAPPDSVTFGSVTAPTPFSSFGRMSSAAPPPVPTSFGSSFGAASGPTFGGFGSAFGTALPQPPAPTPAGFPNPSTTTVEPTQASIYEAELAHAGSMPIPDEDDFEEYDVMEEEGAPGDMVQPTAIVKETPLSMTFAVSERSNIPSDGLGHQVTLAVIPFQAKISYITIPRNDPSIFLQCQVKNTSEYRLLSGPVSVIIDESYMSTTSLTNNINPGDSFVCLLGNDTSTKVVYTRTSKTVQADGGAFSEDTNITTYTTMVSIHNKHAFDITDLVVLDSVPTTEDKRVKVILRKPLGLADAKDGQTLDLSNNGLRVGWLALVDGKGGRTEGKFEWKWKVASGETVTLAAEYDVKVPRDVPWVLSNIAHNS